MKYCPNCHKKCNDTEVYCAQCGSKTEEIINNLENDKNKWILYFILSIIFFFISSKICSIIGIIFSFLMRLNYKDNKIDDYLNDKKIAKITLIINTIAFAFFLTILLICGTALFKTIWWFLFL